MAIKNIETGEVTYEGRVLSISRSCDRVMSDIYADNVYATVVEDDGSLRKMWLYTNFELCTSPKRGEVDCTDAWRTFATTLLESIEQATFGQLGHNDHLAINDLDPLDR